MLCISFRWKKKEKNIDIRENCIASGTINLYSHEMKQNLLLAKCHPRKKNLLHMNWSSLYCFSGEFLLPNCIGTGWTLMLGCADWFNECGSNGTIWVKADYEVNNLPATKSNIQNCSHPY